MIILLALLYKGNDEMIRYYSVVLTEKLFYITGINFELMSNSLEKLISALQNRINWKYFKTCYTFHHLYIFNLSLLIF